MQLIMQLYEFKAYEVLRDIKLPLGKQLSLRRIQLKIHEVADVTDVFRP